MINMACEKIGKLMLTLSSTTVLLLKKNKVTQTGEKRSAVY